ncbi:phosphate/phosphite/phosphonate ABC transporter substrate-binding protein [Ramlibacter sp. WS9]|uniref:phosphate/phosphite/phosphonate ABC transporter substrate-binding protein n=1 Tax=Ramlibacter sp. WS9 TaxID=1882741 RepID=UPI0013053DB4|nr:phosphate/phosphite/phosphonate ABC transporter substrate-binding protein [Ramlibacter sp. WS9]
MKRRLIISAGGLVAAAPALWAQTNPRRPAAKAPPPARLTFGLITPRNAELTLKNWNPFIERMSVSAGLPISAQTYATAAELVKDFVDGKVDLAWLGNAGALEIVEAGKGSVFAVKVNQGKTSYRSVLIAHRDSAIRSLDDVQRQAPQLVFGDGDLKSVSGHIVPMYFAFVKRGANDPGKLFKETKRGSHEANLLATAKREVDVATNNTTELDNLRTNQPEQAALVRVVWESPEIPESPMVWRDSLPASLKTRIAAFTERFGATDPEEKGILWNIDKLTGFRKSTNRQLVTIADIEMFTARQRIINDAGLSAEARLQRVDEVTRRGSKIELMLKASS